MPGLPEDLLLIKLKDSIDQWNGEVSTAHETLARQIRDTRDQLKSLMEILSKRRALPQPPAQAFLPTNGNGNNESVAEIESLQTEIRTLTDTSEKVHVENETLKEERDRLHEQVLDLRPQAEHNQITIEAARQEIETLQRTLDEKNKHLREIQGKLFELQSQMGSSALAQDQESKEALLKAHHEIDSLNFAIASLEERLGELNIRYQKEQAESEALRSRLEANESGHASNEEAVARLQAQNEELRNKMTALEARADEKAVVRLQAENAELRDTITTLEAQANEEVVIAEALPVGSANQEEVVFAQALPFESMDDEESVQRQARLDEREGDLAAREEAVQKAAERMQYLEDTAHRFQEQLGQMEAMQSDSSGHDTTKWQTEIEDRDETIHDLQARMQGMERRLSQTEKQNELLPKHLDNALRELDQTRATLAEKDTELEQMRVMLGQAERAVPDETKRIAEAVQTAEGGRRSIGEILLASGIITESQLESALAEQKVAKKRRLGSILVEKGLVREEIVAQVVAHQLGIRYVQIENESPDSTAIAMLNGRIATHHMCFPLRATSSEILVAMANPMDLIAIEDLEIATSLKVKPVVATLADISAAIVRHYGVSITPTLEDRFDRPSTPMKSSKPSGAIPE